MFSLTENYITRGFWGDEAWSSLISQLPYLQMLKTTAADFHPPAYYTVVELWYKFFPATEVSTRMISVIFYLLTGLLVYKLASFIFKSKFWGYLSALIVLVNPIFFQYAFEARNYTLFAFAATGSVYFLLKFSAQLRDHQASFKNALGFVFFSTLGIYTHYYMFFTLAAGGLYILLFERKLLLKLTLLNVVIVLVYLPWIPYLFGQISSVGQSYWIFPIGNRTHYEAILRILGGEIANDLQIWLFRLSIVLLGVGVIWRIFLKSWEKPYLLIWLWAVVPFVLATLPGQQVLGFKLPFRTIFFWRYLINAAIPLGLLMVAAGQKLPKQVAVLLLSLVIVLSLIVDFWTISRVPYTFREAYEEKVLRQIKTSDTVVTVLPSFAEVLYYRNRFSLNNDLVVLPEGLVQYSGKSLLDAYSAIGVVKIGNAPTRNYFEMRPGPSVIKVENQSVN